MSLDDKKREEIKAAFRVLSCGSGGIGSELGAILASAARAPNKHDNYQTRKMWWESDVRNRAFMVLDDFVDEISKDAEESFARARDSHRAEMIAAHGIRPSMVGWPAPKDSPQHPDEPGFGYQEKDYDQYFNGTDSEGNLIAAEHRDEPRIDSGQFKFCYVDGPWAYFTTQDVKKQWGDGWNDAPYEHNAGRPYEWREDAEGAKYEILKVAYDGPLETPADRGVNSLLSVEAINNSTMPWLRTDKCSPAEPVKIPAGTDLEKFIALVRKSGGKVYIDPEREAWLRARGKWPTGGQDAKD